MKNRPLVCDRSGAFALGEGYLADFSAVRRQRVHASTFTRWPFCIVVNGWKDPPKLLKR